MANTYDILSTTDKKQLINGYIHKTELLPQYHNYALYDAYAKFENNDIKVHNVQSDAFTIHSDDFHKAKCIPNCVMPSLREAVLNFDELIGNWRVSKSPINFPNEKYKYKFNQVIEIPTFEKTNLMWQTSLIQKLFVIKSLNPTRECLGRNIQGRASHT